VKGGESEGAELATFFRQQSGRLTAALTRVLGVGRLDLAEDIVQESLIAALQAWKLGLPRDPQAWLFAVARNRARDALRRERVRGGAGLLGDAAIEALAAPEEPDEHTGLTEMMFSCCHPGLAEEAQIALILRLVCGFGTAEVAHAFLVESAAMEKRLVRAKKVMAAEGRLFEISTPEQTRERLPAVLSALYLMFDAGYHGSATEQPVRSEICADAIRLANLLLGGRATACAEVHALLALMYLHAARMPTRVDAAGLLVPLEHQDRSLWDAALVGLGVQHLSASASGSELSAYHLEAGIAVQHAVAVSTKTTDWPEIVRLYELLYEKKRTPVVALGRAIARAQIVGPRAGIAEVLALEAGQRLHSYPFFWAALGDLAIRAEDPPRARGWFERGLTTARNDAEREMFLRRIAECHTGALS
jgi:RNA polymerase sigma factor (sigma-70 family)